MKNCDKKEEILGDIKENGLIPYYQDIVDKNGNILKKEVLVRSTSSNGEIIGAQEVLSVGVENIREQFKEMFIRAIGESRNNGFDISLNLHKDCIDNEILNLLKQERDKGGNSITVELLENDVLEGKHLKIIKKMKKYGMGIAIDDFPIMNSNHKRFLKFKPDFIKFDGDATKKMSRDFKLSIDLATVLRELKSLGVKTIVEQVDSKDWKFFYEKLGFDYFQGFYINIPNRDGIK